MVSIENSKIKKEKNMYKFNNIEIIPNDEGFVLTNKEVSTQVYLSDFVVYVQPYEHQKWEMLSDEDILRRAKRDKASTLLKMCDSNEEAEKVIQEDFDGLMSLFQNSFDPTRNKKSPKVARIEKELKSEYAQRLENYRKQIRIEKETKGFKRKKVDFRIGEDPTVHTCSCGIDGTIGALDVGIGILDNAMYFDEYDGFDTLSKAIDFFAYFGYDCGEKGIEVVESITKIGKAVGFPVECSNVAVSVWKSNGFGDGDDERVKKGLLPEGDEGSYDLFITIEWKDGNGEEAEYKAGFYGDEEAAKDENIFYYFKDGEEILGDKGNFVVKSLRWE